MKGIGEQLEKQNKVMLIFLDQFENVFFLPEVLERITTLLLRLCDEGSNIILGFSWKTDLVGSTTDFPYIHRDSIKRSSITLQLKTFSRPETEALMKKLSLEMGGKLRKDLQFFLSEFSQGYPWLLKKLCAHVKTQRDQGVSQREIANTLLNVKDLFQEDIRGLSSKEEETLRRVAKISPIAISEVIEVFDSEIVQNLVDLRLLVRVGPKYDIYWDIFRDFLNSEKIPIQENYILRAQVTSILKGTRLLVDKKSKLPMNEFREELDLKEKTSQNIVRDMKLLRLASLKNGKMAIELKLPSSDQGFEEGLQKHMSEYLPRNRLVSNILDKLKTTKTLILTEIAEILEHSSPYISATKKTWLLYARIFSSWLHFANLATFDANHSLNEYLPGKQIRERKYYQSRSRTGMSFPTIQYRPIEKVLFRIVSAISTKKTVDWTGIPQSSISRSLAALEGLSLIKRRASTITVSKRAMEFVLVPEKRNEIFSEQALKIKTFRVFIQLLNDNQHNIKTHSQLSLALKQRLSLQLANSTAEAYVKIMLDWARHLFLAPGVYDKMHKGPIKGWKKKDDTMSLF